MAAKKGQWGGRRPGAGRPTTEHPRVNRVGIMLSDRDLEELKRRAKREGRPKATILADIVHRSLRGRR